jgi:CRP-like cAMP-binding protein
LGQNGLFRFEKLSSRRSLALSQEDLATSLGVSRQSFNRALAERQEQGLINQEYGNVSVIDRGGLKELVNQYLSGA